MRRHFTLINTGGLILVFGAVPLAYVIHNLILMFGMIAVGLALVITSLFLPDAVDND